MWPEVSRAPTVSASMTSVTFDAAVPESKFRREMLRRLLRDHHQLPSWGSASPATGTTRIVQGVYWAACSCFILRSSRESSIFRV